MRAADVCEWRRLGRRSLMAGGAEDLSSSRRASVTAERWVGLSSLGLMSVIAEASARR